jgi:hypothetical protein
MKRRKKKEPDYAIIAIEVEDNSVGADAGINSSLLGSPRFIDDEEETVHEFQTNQEITGLCTDPEDRAGHRFDIHMYSAPDIKQRTPRIKDLRDRNKEGDYRYRAYRGRQYPVYAPPPPVVYIDNVRGENRWLTWAWVTLRMVTDSLILLNGNKQVYVSLHEVKESRKRLIQNLTVQTTDPAEE